MGIEFLKYLLAASRVSIDCYTAENLHLNKSINLCIKPQDQKWTKSPGLVLICCVSLPLLKKIRNRIRKIAPKIAAGTKEIKKLTDFMEMCIHTIQGSFIVILHNEMQVIVSYAT